MKFYELYTDGSHLQDWDIAGIGGYLVCPEGKEVWSFSERIEDVSLNSKHEILALEAGLLRCIEQKITHLVCYSDLNSLSLALNLKKEDLKNFIIRNPIFERIVSLIHQFEVIDFKYIPRSKNYKADRLSKQKILEDTQYRNKRVDNAFRCKNFVCAENYPKNKRFRFFKIHHPIENYLVFHTKDNNILDIYEVTKRDAISYKKVQTLVLRKEWEMHLLEVITQYLSQSSLERIGIMLKPVGNSLDKKLRGTKEIAKDEAIVFKNFKSSLKNFKKVVLNFHREIYHTIFTPETKVMSEERLIEDMKTLGECEDPHTTSLQKKEFGEFINLMIHHQNGLPKDIQSIILKAREKLVAQGVKLKI